MDRILIVSYPDKIFSYGGIKYSRFVCWPWHKNNRSSLCSGINAMLHPTSFICEPPAIRGHAIMMASVK
jgi:hypothetical protein